MNNNSYLPFVIYSIYTKNLIWFSLFFIHSNTTINPCDNLNMLISRKLEIYLKSSWIYLQIVPIQEKLIILGCQKLRVGWKPSKQLVCAFEENVLMSFTIRWFRNIECNLSWAVVSSKWDKLFQNNAYIQNIHRMNIFWVCVYMYIYNIYNIFIYLKVHSTAVIYPDNLVWSLGQNVSNHDNKIKAMVNNKCMLKSMYNDYLSSSFIHNGEWHDSHPIYLAHSYIKFWIDNWTMEYIRYCKKLDTIPIHFLGSSSSCKHFWNNALGWFSCFPAACLINEVHFASITPSKPVFVVLAAQ